MAISPSVQIQLLSLVLLRCFDRYPAGYSAPNRQQIEPSKAKQVGCQESSSIRARYTLRGDTGFTIGKVQS